MTAADFLQNLWIHKIQTMIVFVVSLCITVLLVVFVPAAKRSDTGVVATNVVDFFPIKEDAQDADTAQAVNRVPERLRTSFLLERVSSDSGLSVTLLESQLGTRVVNETSVEITCGKPAQKALAAQQTTNYVDSSTNDFIKFSRTYDSTKAPTDVSYTLQEEIGVKRHRLPIRYNLPLRSKSRYRIISNALISAICLALAAEFMRQVISVRKDSGD